MTSRRSATRAPAAGGRACSLLPVARAPIEVVRKHEIAGLPVQDRDAVVECVALADDVHILADGPCVELEYVERGVDIVQVLHRGVDELLGIARSLLELGLGEDLVGGYVAART